MTEQPATTHAKPKQKNRRFKRLLVGTCLGIVGFFVLSLALTALLQPQLDRNTTTTTKQPAAQASETPAPKADQDIADTFKTYDGALYDKDTDTYSFNSNDYGSLFGDTSLSDSGEGLKSGTITRGGKTWNVNCYSSLNSCSVSSSTGTYGNVHCYEYTNSCSYSDTDGNYANTHCYEYTNSCNTTGSDGYSSSTHCYEYTNSCSTTDSNGGYSSTHCYQYTNSCSTNNSDGSTTNTYCYQYTNSCSSSTYGGSSSYDSYSNYY